MTKTTLPIAGQGTPSKPQDLKTLVLEKLGLKKLGSKPQRLAVPSHQPSAAAAYLPETPASEGDSASRQSATLPASQKSPSFLDFQASTEPRDEVGEKERLARHLSCWVLLLTLVANVATAREPGANEVRLDSLEVTNITFKTPIHRSDSQGKQQGYEEGILVLVKGDFPAYRAEPFELFIGDYQIKEYSGTQEEIQIIFFEPGQIDRLEGQEWRYRYPHGELQSLGVAFGRNGLRALSTAPAPKESSP